MRNVTSVLCFLVFGVGSSGGSVSAQQAGGCTVPPPAPTWTCVNGNWLPPPPTTPAPPAPAPPAHVINVGETVSGLLSSDWFDSTGFHPGVFEIVYELTAPTDGFLTAELDYDYRTSSGASLQLEHVSGSWPTPSIATLQVVAGGTYRILVSSNSWDLIFVSFVLATSISPEAPVPVISCTTPWPALDWICINGGWVPPGHPLAQGGATPQAPPAPAPPVAGPQGCPTAQPASTWVCVNGDWLPPDHPLALSAPPSPIPAPPTTPLPPAPAGACTTPDPFIGIPGLVGVCLDGNIWVPIGHPLARGGG